MTLPIPPRDMKFNSGDLVIFMLPTYPVWSPDHSDYTALDAGPWDKPPVKRGTRARIIGGSNNVSFYSVDISHLGIT